MAGMMRETAGISYETKPEAVPLRTPTDTTVAISSPRPEDVEHWTCDDETQRVLLQLVALRRADADEA